MSEKFIEGAKTLRVLLILAIVMVVCIGVYMMITHTANERQVTMKLENLRLAYCQETVVAKGRCNVKAEISEPQKFAGFTMPGFMPGSKSVSYDGSVIMRFGYDSTTPLFPKGTVFEENTSGAGDAKYIIRIPSIPKPKVLPDPAVRGYAHESKSFFTGDIPPDTFFSYIDSLVILAGTKAIENDPDYFEAAYVKMTYDLIHSIMGNRNACIIIIGDAMFDPDVSHELKQDFVEDIEGVKKL